METRLIAWEPMRVTLAEMPALKAQHPESITVDETQKNLEELFLLRNPKYKFDKNYGAELAIFRKEFEREDFGVWFYFPWANAFVRYFPEDLHFELRTGRNKYLISTDEQKKFYDATIAFLGMSVGSHAAIVTAMSGGAKHMRLADPDALSGDNLNRIRTGFQNVGINKCIAVARQIFEINPYAEIEIFQDGITVDNAAKILDSADIVVEEMDNPYWKFRARELARERGIPVLMATDNGDGVITDIERYDLNRNLRLFNGLAGNLSAEGLKAMPPKDLPKVAGKIAGMGLTVPRMLDSVSEVGKSLYSWPQLGTAANMCGTIIALLARRIINKEKNIKSGRYSVNPDAIFESDYGRKWFSRKMALVRFIRKMSKS